MADSYSKLRATREEKERKSGDFTVSKSNKRKMKSTLKKSPLLIVIVVTMLVGLLLGYFLAIKTSEFSFNDYYVNGVKATELDYIVVDVTSYKEKLEELYKDEIEAGTKEITMDEVYNGIVLKDDGVTCKVLSTDANKSVTIKYFYREDISVDPVEVDKVDVRTPGVYYIEYSSSSFAYKNTKLIRTIVVLGVEDNG